MKIFKKSNVYEEALDRIRYIFDEFPNVIVSFSGGKDSTVVFHLALEIAREKNRLPLKVAFIDQEAEWQATADYVDYVMTLPEVEPLWFQIPIKLFNATSGYEKWLQCWDPKEEGSWIRPKADYAIKDNIYGKDRFVEVAVAISKHMYPEESVCWLTGIRAQESPSRLLGLTQHATYKHITYGKQLWKGHDHYNFHPIYDWNISDVWKYIGTNNFPYNRVYDYMYQHGVALNHMRVSNLHHETAVRSLYILQEIEPETWNKVCGRLQGINTAGHLGEDDYFDFELPYMFKEWKEYRDYLLHYLIVKPDEREIFRKKFRKLDSQYAEMNYMDGLYKQCITSLLANDSYFTKLDNWERGQRVFEWKRWTKNGVSFKGIEKNKYITG